MEEGIVHRVRDATGEPEGALVLLHGRGTSEHDLEPLLDVLDPDRRLVGLAPRGPLTFPPGGAHRYGLARVGFPDPDTFLSAFALLSSWLDGTLEELGVPLERTIMGGFSQGSVMSYALALGARRPAPAGIVALSGFIPTVPGFELDLTEREGLPAAIGHGTFDPIIGVEWGRDARNRLEAAGADVTYRESPMAHSVDPRFLAELSGWIERALGRVERA